jgi:hypothetical protein
MFLGASPHQQQGTRGAVIIDEQQRFVGGEG